MIRIMWITFSTMNSVNLYNYNDNVCRQSINTHTPANIFSSCFITKKKKKNQTIPQFRVIKMEQTVISRFGWNQNCEANISQAGSINDSKIFLKRTKLCFF